MEAPTRAVASFVTKLGFDQLPPALVTTIKKNMLDTIGCCIYGAGTSWSKIITRYVIEQQGRPDASLWFQDFVGPVNTVAMALGVMAHSFELDDYHSAAKLHPGAVVVPAAIPVAERINSNGKDLICAVLAGYEVMIRSCLAAGTLSTRKRGWHLTGVCGTFGAAAATGYLLSLDEDQMANALGLAGTQSAGLFALQLQRRGQQTLSSRPFRPKRRHGRRTRRPGINRPHGNIRVCGRRFLPDGLGCA